MQDRRRAVNGSEADMSNRQDKWWLRPVRMIRRDYLTDFSAFIGSDLDALARETKERWHANCEWVIAAPGCAPGMGQYTLFNSEEFEKLPGVGDFDLLREYLPHARRHGVRLVPYLNMHWYSYEFAVLHPGWEQLLEDGTPYGRARPLYGGGTTFCVNGPWRDWAFEMIREVMRTGVDGCFLDGPVVFPGCCYCEHCRRLFSDSNKGAPLPAWNDWSNPSWKRFLEFRADSWARFMRDARAAARGINPEAVIFLNGGGFGIGNADTARDAHRMERWQSFTGAEQFFHCTDAYVSPYRTLNLSRFLSAGERPGVVFTHHALSTWHYNPLPAAEMATALAQSVAGGSNTWFAIFMPAMRSHADEAFRGVEETAAFLERAEPFTTMDAPAAETGVLLSNRTLYYYVSRHREICRDVGSGREENLTVDSGSDAARLRGIQERRQASLAILEHEYPGCLDACNFGHIPLRVFWDEHLLEKKLDEARVLVLPNAACLSRAQVAAVIRFVKRGGGLVATFESGMYDEWGEPVARREWLRFLGVARVDGAFAPSRVEDYLTVTRPLPWVPAGALLPRPVNALKVRPTRDARALAFYNEPIGLSYAPLSEPSAQPAILSARRGKGRVVYCASPIFESFDRFHIDAHKVLCRALIALAAGRAGLQVETDAPGSLAVELRSQPGRLLVHLVNATADMKRPMGAIVPLRDVEIAVRAGGVKSVRALKSRRRLKFTAPEDRVRFRVPVVEDYEIIVLDQRERRR